MPVIASDSSDQLTNVPTSTASFVAVLTINTLRNLISALCASTPSVTCLKFLVTAFWPEPQLVTAVEIIK